MARVRNKKQETPESLHLPGFGSGRRKPSDRVERRGQVAILALVMLAGYAPGLLSGATVLGSLPRYVTEEYFNPSLLRSLVELLKLPQRLASLGDVGTHKDGGLDRLGARS